MNAICVTCGTQFRETDRFPESCTICEDERQYVGLHGQQWTTLDDLRRNYGTTITEEEAELTAFSVEPKFGIGQRAFLAYGCSLKRRRPQVGQRIAAGIVVIRILAEEGREVEDRT